ncbi:hypothetical protein [Variovorax sp. HJSM1_2]|uniref:hypothetical protein n=1 Tax=Variovorax sp. HJSM1_2 TaxID=3366263 RepID=UPI003BEAE346
MMSVLWLLPRRCMVHGFRAFCAIALNSADFNSCKFAQIAGRLWFRLGLNSALPSIVPLRRVVVLRDAFAANGSQKRFFFQGDGAKKA